MAQVPKIVTQRLQAARPGPHPDPNLLTALVEKSLTERERVQVLEHLANCADCRDAVSLSLPDFETKRVIPAAPTKSGWLTWRMLRWGAAAACVVVVGAAVTLHFGKRATMAPEAPATASAVEEKSAATLPMPAAPEPAQPKRDLYAARDAEKKLTANAATAPISAAQQAARAKGDLTAAAPALSKQLGVPGLAESREVATHVTAARSDNRPPTPPASQMADAVSPSAKSAELDKKEAGATEQVEVSAAPSYDEVAPKPAPPLEVAQATTGKAKDASQKTKAPAAGVVGGAITANAKQARSETAENELKSSYASNLVIPRWTLSSDGTLQRSLDAGKTWQPVSVPGHGTFRALAAVGAEIWVGGAKGALYHSADIGEHWVQLKPIADGKSLTADIIGVEFTDARHGKLTTAANETWTTTDGGQSWQTK
jgi:hypothetical protein